MTARESHLPALGAAGRWSRMSPISSSSVCADDQPAVAHGARRRHGQHQPGRASRCALLRSGRRHRHRSATGRPARAEARHRRLRDQLLPVRRVRSPRLPLAVQPGEGRRPGDVCGRGSCSWSCAVSRAWSCGPPAARRCPCSTSGAGQPRRRAARPRRVALLGARADDRRGQDGPRCGDRRRQRRNVSRLICAAPARPGTELPRVRGAGVRGRTGRRPRRADGRCRRCCRRGSRATQATPSVELPVYYSWEFRTSDGGDFEELVRRLRAARAAAGVGKRPMDVSHPGFCLDPQPSTARRARSSASKGALRVVDSEPDDWADETRRPFQTALAAILNTPWRLATTDGWMAIPIVAPPIYGAWHAGVHEVIAGRRRRRRRRRGSTSSISIRDIASAAALGTEVVQARAGSADGRPRGSSSAASRRSTSGCARRSSAAPSTSATTPRRSPASRPTR